MEIGITQELLCNALKQISNTLLNPPKSKELIWSADWYQNKTRTFQISVASAINLHVPETAFAY